MKRNESLVMMFLSHRRKKYICGGCDREHREWFAINQPTGIRVLNLCADWAELKPYNKEGKLTGLWVRLIQKRAGNFKGGSFEDLLSHWEGVFMRPTKEDMRDFEKKEKS